MNSSQKFLLLSAIILIPIGLTYGAIPEGSMQMIFGLSIEPPDLNLVHMLRALTGLYVGMALFWMAAAFRDSLIVPALWSVLIFMLGVAVGRIVGFLIDGPPLFWGFGFFCISELLLAAAATYFLRAERLDVGRE